MNPLKRAREKFYEVLRRKTYPVAHNTTDAENLRLLAAWFDTEEKTGRWGDCTHEVQDNLRRIADNIEKIPDRPIKNSISPQMRWAIRDFCKKTLRHLDSSQAVALTAATYCLDALDALDEYEKGFSPQACYHLHANERGVPTCEFREACAKIDEDPIGIMQWRYRRDELTAKNLSLEAILKTFKAGCLDLISHWRKRGEKEDNGVYADELEQLLNRIGS